MNEASRASNNVEITSYQLALDGGQKADATKDSDHTITGFTEPGTVHQVVASLATNTSQTFSDVTLSFCLEPVTATVDHTQTVPSTNQLQFQYPTVASGEATGYKISVSGCNLASPVTKDQTSAVFLIDGLSTPGCEHDVTVTSYCSVNGVQVDGDPLTFTQCTS